MFNWLSKSSQKNLTGIVQHTEGLAFASIASTNSSKPLLTECLFQPQLSDTKTTLKQLLQSLTIKKTTLTTLLGASEFTFLLMQRPTVEDQELSDAVRWQIKDQLKYPAEEAIIQILDIPGQQERGRLPMIYVVAAHQDTVKSSIDLLSESKFDLRYIDIPELAQRNISALLPEDFIGVALLHLAPNHSLLTITHEGELYLSRVIDIGYEHLEDNELDTTPNNGLSLENEPSEKEQNIEKIVLEIQRSLDYYESHYGKATIGNLILAPMETELKDLNTTLEQSLGVVVRSLNLNEIIDTTKNIDNEIQSKCFSAIGAALRQTVEVTAEKKFD